MKTKKKFVVATIWAAVVTALTLPLSAGAQEEVKAAGRKSVSITVYNQNFGIVREVRDLSLKDGVNFVRFEDVAEQIEPTTVSFKSLTAPDAVTVLEQNYQYDMLGPVSVLNKSVGKHVVVRHYSPDGRMSESSGTLMVPPREWPSIMLKTDGGAILNASGEVEISELPTGLVPKPSLLWKLMATKAGEHTGELAYQTRGINWNCDYVVVVNDAENKADLNGWVTLNNQSGASYNHAALKLLAGDVHLAPRPRMMHAAMSMGTGAYQAAPAQFEENSFSEYHLYTLNGQTDLRDKETKQVSLFNAANVSVKKRYVFDSQSARYFAMSDDDSDAERRQKVAVKIEAINSKDEGLGMALPKGTVRVFKKDKDNALQLIGEDSIDHTPQGEKVRFTIGDAFDLVAIHKQTNVSKLNSSLVNSESKASYEIVLRNHKKEDVTVTCVEHANGKWKVTDSSQPFVKKSSTLFEFDVNVPANGEAKVTYTIEQKN